MGAEKRPSSIVSIDSVILWTNDLRHHETQPRVEKMFEEIAKERRKFYLDRRLTGTKTVITKVSNPSSNGHVIVLVEPKTEERLPIRFSFPGSYYKGHTTADYDEVGKLQVLRVGVDGPPSKMGNLFYLPLRMPVAEFEFYDRPRLKIWENSTYKNSLVERPLRNPTDVPALVDRSPLVFSHGEVETTISTDHDILIVSISRPDNIKKITWCPISIGKINFAKLQRGEPSEYLKLPTSSFGSKYLEGDNEISIEVHEF